LLFNPPYIATTDEEFAKSAAVSGDSSISALATSTWAGGKDGMETTNRVLELLDVCLYNGS